MAERPPWTKQSATPVHPDPSDRLRRRLEDPPPTNLHRGVRGAARESPSETLKRTGLPPLHVRGAARARRRVWAGAGLIPPVRDSGPQSEA